ncbi:MAG: T9SS type A sorting domain-containing protein, partial [Bacteroidota bacterium]
GLTTNSLGDLDIPSNWSSFSDEHKVLFLLNAEREARSGIDYGDGAILGLPFTAVETNVDNLAQAHADDQLANNTFSHTGSDGSSPFDRIDNDLVIGGSCHEFISYAENIAGFWSLGGTNSFVPERAVYNWIYEDSGSTWGHRRACLIQDSYSNPVQTGFTNNLGANGSEGYIGVGFASSENYDLGNSGVTDGDIVVLKIFDPVASGCAYNEVLSVQETRETPPVKVYPNPVRDEHKIYLQNTPVESTVEIIDVFGKTISVQKLLHDKTINLPRLSQGIYLLRISSPESITTTVKLVKS